jgi:pimeloyl-ACP methyl ester carboxylesterase
VCLERTIELDNVRLGVRDWPGLGAPLVHVPDSLAPSRLIDVLASQLTPRHRVLSVAARAGVPYQVEAFELLGVLQQFGFVRPVLIGERRGCLPVVLLAAWYPWCVGRVILVDPTCEPPTGESVEARALRVCPPDWPALRGLLTCHVLQLRIDDPAVASRVEAYFDTPLP